MLAHGGGCAREQSSHCHEGMGSNFGWTVDDSLAADIL